MKEMLLFAALFVAVAVAAAFYFSPTLSLKEQKVVTKVIDGDTVVIEGGSSVRLLGIDADERGKMCYNQAKQKLEELTLNKKVFLESGGKDKDKYGRYLRYVFVGSENINLRMVREGLAIAYFSSDNEKYKEEITAAEKQAMNSKTGCKWE